MKTMTAAARAEAAKLTGQIERHFVELHFNPVIYLTDHSRDMPWNSNTYEAGGHYLGYSDLSESTALQAGNFNIVMSAVEQTYVALILQNTHMDRRVVIRRWWLDDNDQMVDGPVMIKDARIHGANLDEEANPPKVIINCGDRMTGKKVNGLRTTEASLQTRFPDDRFFEFAHVKSEEKVWGAP